MRNDKKLSFHHRHTSVKLPLYREAMLIFCRRENTEADNSSPSEERTRASCPYRVPPACCSDASAAADTHRRQGITLLAIVLLQQHRTLTRDSGQVHFCHTGPTTRAGSGEHHRTTGLDWTVHAVNTHTVRSYLEENGVVVVDALVDVEYPVQRELHEVEVRHVHPRRKRLRQ